MSIEYRTGDLFLQPDINVICHQANHWGTLARRCSSGIAHLIEKYYPEAADADKPPYDKSKLGTWSRGAGQDGRLVYNCYTQDGTDTRYDAVVAVFDKLERQISYYDELVVPEAAKVIGVPYGYGSNIANGRWTIVSAIFQSIFTDSPVKFVVVRLPNQSDLK